MSDSGEQNQAGGASGVNEATENDPLFGKPGGGGDIEIADDEEVAKMKGEIKERLVVHSQQLTENALSAIFLARENRVWNDFPYQMKGIWLLSAVSGSIVQWLSTVLLAKYLFGELKDRGDDEDEDQGLTVQFVTTILCEFMLLSYVMGEIRRGFTALMVCFHRLGNPQTGDGWSRFILLGFLLELLLQFTVSIVSTMGIVAQDNISDKLGAALGFFFILEIDEYIYVAFMQDFGVFEGEDDFVLEIEREENEEEKMSVEQIWSRRAQSSVFSLILFGALLIFSGVWAGLNWKN